MNQDEHVYLFFNYAGVLIKRLVCTKEEAIGISYAEHLEFTQEDE